MALRCAIYARFSSEMQSARSVVDQERECAAYAKRLGWEVVLTERDEAVRAGAIAGRIGYQRLVAAAQARRYDVLLVEEVSRFSRDFLGGFAALADLKKQGVQLADTRSGPLDLDTVAGQLQVAFGLATSQAETQRLGERSKRGLKGKVLGGYSAGGQPAYGYARAPVFSTTQVDVDGRPIRVGVRFEPHPVEAPILKRIFELFDSGTSKHGIATRFNREGIPSRRAGAMRAGRPNSGTWTTAAIKRVLENPIYVGDRIWDRTSRKGEKSARTGKKQQKKNPESTWTRVKQYAAPLIPEDLWDRVQERCKRDGQKYKQKHTANENKRYLLSGLIRCAGCGASFVIGAYRGRPRRAFYRCNFHAARGATVCTNSIVVSQHALEGRVKELLEVVVKDPRQLGSLVAEHNRQISSTNEGQLAMVRALETRQRAAAEERDRLVSAIALGTGAPRILVAEVEKREKEVADLEARIAETEATIQPLLLPKPAAVRDYVSGNASLFSGDQARDRQLLEGVVEGILVYDDGSVAVQFRQASLFEPIRLARLPAVTDGPGGALAARRAVYSAELEAMRVHVANTLTPQQAGNLEVDVLHDEHGEPAYVMMTPGVVTRTTGSKIALASPAGVEPALAT